MTSTTLSIVVLVRAIEFKGCQTWNTIISTCSELLFVVAHNVNSLWAVVHAARGAYSPDLALNSTNYPQNVKDVGILMVVPCLYLSSNCYDRVDVSIFP